MKDCVRIDPRKQNNNTNTYFNPRFEIVFKNACLKTVSKHDFCICFQKKKIENQETKRVPNEP